MSADEQDALEAASPKELPQPRKQLALYGRHGDTVKAVDDTKENRIVVYYRDADGRRHRVLYPRTPKGRADAKAFAESWHDERQRLRGNGTASEAAPTTMHELWELYSQYELKGRREATQVSYTQHWRHWEAFIGRDRLVDSVTHTDCEEFRQSQKASGASPNQSRTRFGVVKIAYTYGAKKKKVLSRDVLDFEWTVRDDDAPPLKPKGFVTAQYDLLRAALDPEDARQWRPWVLMTLAGLHGQRARALRHLRWQDIDLTAGVITWPAKYQKNKKELQQPILSETRVALDIAMAWRERASKFRVRPHHKTATARPERLKEADWVIFAERDKAKPVSYSSVHYHLLKAESRAGIAHDPRRAYHGFRRMVVGIVGKALNRPTAGLEYIGHRGTKMFGAYDRLHQERVDEAGAAMESVRKVSGNTNAAPTEGGEVKS